MKRNRLGILLVILTFLTCSIGTNKESYAESNSRMGYHRHRLMIMGSVVLWNQEKLLSHKHPVSILFTA